MPQKYTDLSQRIKESLQNALELAGLFVEEVIIKDITIPNNTSDRLEKQFFAIAEAERVKKYEYSMEEISLSLYEKKAKIHEQYPNFPITLTESEKDFALNRYLRRKGEDISLLADIDKEQLEKSIEQGSGTITKAKLNAPIPPIEPKKPSSFRKIYIILTIIALVFSGIMFAVSLIAGLVLLGITILIAGILGAVKLNALKEGKKESQAYEEYKKLYKEYEEEYAAYNASKNDNKIL